MKKLYSLIKIIQRPRGVVLLILIILLLINHGLMTHRTIRTIRENRQRNPYIFIGNQFLPLKSVLKKTPRIGYYTDKSMDDIHTAAQFAQAQYILSPIILELNALNHPFVIFDFANPSFALEKTQKLGMIPLQQSSTGIILAKNPQYHNL